MIQPKLRQVCDTYAGDILKIVHETLSKKNFTKQECLEIIEHLMNDCYNKALQAEVDSLINDL